MLTGCTKTENYGVKLPVAVKKFYYGFKNAHFKTVNIYYKNDCFYSHNNYGAIL